MKMYHRAHLQPRTDGWEYVSYDIRNQVERLSSSYHNYIRDILLNTYKG